MALPVSKIGIYSFMSLRGQIEAPHVMHEVDQRAGVDGTEILNTGKRGVPFTLVSRVDCESYNAAQHLFKEYKDIMIPSGSLPVVQSDFDTIDESFFCTVLGVRLLSIQRAPVIVGGLQYTTGAILEAEWTLIGISMEGL